MARNIILTGVIIEQSDSLTLEEFCKAVQANREAIIQMVEYQLIQPQGDTPEQWRFDSLCLKQGRIAASFHRDLEINMPGVALALELMKQIEELEHQVRLLEKKGIIR